MTRIDGSWLRDPAMQQVLRLLTDAGFQAFAVGGCVRNALLNMPVSDVDIATDAHPDTTMSLAKEAGLRPVPTGIDHGTVTVVADGTGYEVTTFRSDVETDGRHAVVRFSTNVQEDARRRDFTMNALYARADGSVVDPLGGLKDLTARKVRFIEDAGRRIEEDYLRILRFFRFSAWYGDPDLGFDTDALAAIADHLDGLDGLSRERVGSEIKKLMAAPDPAPAVSGMQQTGVLQRCLPGADPSALAVLVHLEAAQDVPPDALRRMAGIGAFNGDALRLSRADQRQLALYQSLIGTAQGAAELGYRHGADMARDVLLLRGALFEHAISPADLGDIVRGADARFPVSAADLMPQYQGAALGARLKALENRWIASGFALSREDLLA